MGFQYQKVKSVAKTMRVKSPALQQKILDTMKLIADMVGATLGPGGQPVLIERQEHDLPAMVTKDGVTVYRSLGFDDPVAHVIMESGRDCATRTANEAGDGTTTATVLAEAIVRNMFAYTKAHPKVSPQKIVRRLLNVFGTEIEPLVKKLSTKVDPTTEEGRKALWNVAKISANGDTDLADAVMECFDVVGDDGNVTLTEINGPSGYEVERIDGYPIPTGYEDSCAKYASKFMNDPANQRVVLDDPLFVVYHGQITEIQSIVFLMEKIGEAWQSNKGFRHNVVLVSTGFSERVLAQLALNFAEATTINVYPLIAPLSPVPGGQLGFLQDVCAVTGSKLFDPLNNPLDRAELSELGQFAKTFEAARFRSVIVSDDLEVGEPPVVPEGVNEDEYPEMLIWAGRRDKAEAAAFMLEEQIQKLQAQKLQAASILDTQIIEERLGKLTGGIAKLKIVGASNGELRERRDRAEDAVCAVRGTIKNGYLPGGCWTLTRIAAELSKKNDEIINEVLLPSLGAPAERLFSNCGYTHEEMGEILQQIANSIFKEGSERVVYDALEQRFVDPVEGGVLDSTPAVLEAIRNSLSIATLHGTLGAVCVFKRDLDLERKEASDTSSFLRDGNYPENPADTRGF